MIKQISNIYECWITFEFCIYVKQKIKGNKSFFFNLYLKILLTFVKLIDES